MPPPTRLPLLAAVTAAAALASAPALASEPLPTPPPPPGPTVFVLPGFAQLPAPAALRARPSLRSVRVVPRKIRSGKRARLRLRLSEPARLRIVIRRGAHRVRTVTVQAPAGKVSVRLPGRVHGHTLRAGRYRISVVAVDATGRRSATVRRTLRVR